MRTSSVFWGIVVLLAGLLLLGSNMGLLPINSWAMIWPLFLIAAGLWFLVMPRLNRDADYPVEHYTLPLEGASSATIKLEHGGGKLELRGADLSGNLLDGTFAGGVEPRISRNSGEVQAFLSSKVHIVTGWPTFSKGGLAWNIQLSREVPIELKVETGASETVMDLSDVKVSALKIETGASSTKVILPSNAGFTRVEASAGAAALEFTVPANVAARIKIESAITGKNINSARFPRTGDYYESAGYEQAINKVEIHIETGVGSIDIH